METMIEVRDVSMRFRMANDRISSIKEYAIARLRGKLKSVSYTHLTLPTILRV